MAACYECAYAEDMLRLCGPYFGFYALPAGPHRSEIPNLAHIGFDSSTSKYTSKKRVFVFGPRRSFSLIVPSWI